MSPTDPKLAEHDAMLALLLERDEVIEGGFAAMMMHKEAAGTMPPAELVKVLRDAFFAWAHHAYTTIKRIPKGSAPLFVTSLDLEFARHQETIADEHAAEVAAFDARYRLPPGSTH